MKTKPKIAIYSGEIPSTTFIERLIKGLSDKGCEILLFGRIKENVNYNGHVLIKGYRSGKIPKLLYLIHYSLLLWLFKNKDKRKLDQILRLQCRVKLYDKVKCYPILWHKPDVFHVQWAKGIADYAWVQDFGIKLVLSLRGAHINYSPIADFKLAEMYRQNFPQIDGFHAVSKAIAEEAQNYGAQQEKIKVIYSGLPGINKTLSSKTPNEPFQILSVGRSHWIKGYSYALDACQQLKEAGFSFYYTIVGSAHDIELQYQIEDLGLQEHVKLLKQMPYEIVKDLMEQSDLLLLSSLKEGIANVVLEAMAFGTLVLSTSCGGMEEVLQNGNNGFLVPIRNSEAIADAIIQIHGLSEEKHLEIRQSAQKAIQKAHTDEMMVEQMIHLYKQILNPELV